MMPCCNSDAHMPGCPNGRKVVLVDIDHVISNAFHRDILIGNVSWDEYHAAMKEDEPIHDIVNLINCLHAAGFVIIALTARPEKWRNLTISCLVKFGVNVDEILMREDNAFRRSPEIKMELVQKRLINLKDDVIFLLEDREDVVASFKELGITVLQVHGRRS